MAGELTNENGNAGANKLARVVADRIRAHMEDIPDVLDFGVICEDWSLLTNSFPKNIPKSDYQILRHIGNVEIETTTVGIHSHKARLPKLKKGDRVLVAWVNDEPVVLDVVWSASRI